MGPLHAMTRNVLNIAMRLTMTLPATTHHSVEQVCVSTSNGVRVKTSNQHGASSAAMLTDFAVQIIADIGNEVGMILADGKQGAISAEDDVLIFV